MENSALPRNISSDNHIATPSLPQVDFVVQVHEVYNPLGLESLKTKKIYQVWQVLMVQGVVVNVLGLMSSTTVDDRYLLN